MVVPSKTVPLPKVEQAVVEKVVVGTESSAPISTRLNVDQLVKDIKWLCADARVARAIIASNEGFELLNVNEVRFEKMMAEEMSLQKAKDYRLSPAHRRQGLHGPDAQEDPTNL